MRLETSVAAGLRDGKGLGPSAAERHGRAVAFFLALTLALAGCARLPSADPHGTFAIEQFFAGKAVSRGNVRTLYVSDSPFTASFTGKSTKDGFDLSEHFAFSDGDPMQLWHLREDADGRLAGDVRTMLAGGIFAPGVPVEGFRTSTGAVIAYDGYAPGGGTTKLHFRHWMEMQPDGTVHNDVAISKFGLPLAHASVVFSRVEPQG